MSPVLLFMAGGILYVADWMKDGGIIGCHQGIDQPRQRFLGIRAES